MPESLCGRDTLGKYRYKGLPMGVSQAPDLCQEIMESIFNDMADVEVFLVDIGIFLTIALLTCARFARSSAVCKTLDSPSTLLSVNGWYKRRTG